MVNLSKVVGEFQTPKQLITAILKEHSKYEEEFEEMEGTLVSKNKLVKVDVVEEGVLLVVLVDREAELPIPTIVSSRLSLIFNRPLNFPMKLSGELKDLVEKEEISKFLANVKAGLAFTTVSALAETSSKELPWPQKDSLKTKSPALALTSQKPDFVSSINPSSIGHSDLDPVAAAPGMIGGYPAGFPSSGGMIVGPDHPMFTNPNPTIGLGGFPSSPGSLPIGSVPPGARFDPISPFGPQPGFGNRPSGGFAARPPGSSGRRPPFSGDPDNDAFMPPGQNTFY